MRHLAIAVMGSSASEGTEHHVSIAVLVVGAGRQPTINELTSYRAHEPEQSVTPMNLELIDR